DRRPQLAGYADVGAAVARHPRVGQDQCRGREREVSETNQLAPPSRSAWHTSDSTGCAEGSNRGWHAFAALLGARDSTLDGRAAKAWHTPGEAGCAELSDRPSPPSRSAAAAVVAGQAGASRRQKRVTYAPAPRRVPDGAARRCSLPSGRRV